VLSNGGPQLWPERVKGLVAVSGYLIGSQAAGKVQLSRAAEYQWWYQYYFATERGAAGYAANRHDFNKLIWKLASPKWAFDDATFDRSAAAFDNPDTAGGLAWPTANAGMTRLSSVLPPAPQFRCRRSRWKAMPTAHRIRHQPLMPASLRVNTSTAPSAMASDTICRRKRRAILRKQ
jgi:hypothetical protein